MESLLDNSEGSGGEQNMKTADKSFDYTQNVSQIRSVEPDHTSEGTVAVRQPNRQCQPTTSWWRRNVDVWYR